MNRNRKFWYSVFIFLAWHSISRGQTSPHETLSIECTSCHVTSSWTELKTPLDFDHSTTIFPLNGRHATTTCKQCHTTLKFAGTQTDCFTCHQGDFQQVRLPDHQLGRFSHDCTTCHSINGWRPSIFDHQKTNFQLTGSHIAVDCYSCHQNAQFADTPTDCYLCHRADFARAQNPNHQQSQFSRDCSSCHSTAGWIPSTFDHNKTSFPLQGAHQSVQCSMCHKNGQFQALPTDCYSCHLADFAVAQNPNHQQSQFSHDCSTCHSVAGWSPSTFDHNKTSFPLQGAHQSVQCSACHKNGQFGVLPTDCYSCHVTDFNNAQSPNHQLNQFSHDCTSCHTVSAWNPSTFDHSNTPFPLTGAHLTTDCLFCHKNGQFKGLSTNCFSCHQTDFNNASDPNHVSGNFDHNCATCHTTAGWTPATFDHSKTNFPLTGAHLQATCISCHINNRFAGTPTDCFSCHSNDYNNASNPNHSSAKYPLTCASCHTTNGWQPATFDHTSFFPINAGSVHSPGRWTFCSDCHTNQSNPATFECINCHQHSKSETDSNHRDVSGYQYLSTACYKCHPQGR